MAILEPTIPETTESAHPVIGLGYRDRKPATYEQMSAALTAVLEASGHGARVGALEVIKIGHTWIIGEGSAQNILWRMSLEVPRLLDMIDSDALVKTTTAHTPARSHAAGTPGEEN